MFKISHVQDFTRITTISSKLDLLSQIHMKHIMNKNSQHETISFAQHYHHSMQATTTPLPQARLYQISHPCDAPAQDPATTTSRRLLFSHWVPSSCHGRYLLLARAPCARLLELVLTPSAPPSQGRDCTLTHVSQNQRCQPAHCRPGPGRRDEREMR
jgi:hypothetical protein